MIHLGDITKIHGDSIEPVDCITGGSPCQDISVAGKRAGLAGERSGLFMEQIRIVKEMRERDRCNGRTDQFIRPRYMVWENVPGAFSSNGGKDFQAVLKEIVRISEPESPDVPLPEKGWPKSGCLYDDMGLWSVAWRVHDAQFWGVPQRRKRIALVADFGGLSAPEILFERKGVSGDPEQGGTERERDSGTVKAGANRPSYTLKIRGGCDGGGKGPLIQTEKSATLRTLQDQTVFCLQGNGIDRSETAECNGKGWKEDICYTLNTIDRPAVLDISHANDVIRDCGNIVPTLQSRMGTGGNQVPVIKDYCTYQKVTGALCANSHPGSYTGQDAYNDMLVTAVDCRNFTENEKINGTLQAKENGGSSINLNNIARINIIVRRLTPLECERLQGFPDGWTDISEWTDSKGKKHKASDTPRYKALGNSIAIPFWFYLLRRISAQYERPATLGSLFDGIGGFPLCWEKVNGKGTARWASEIEEFQIAVTKLRFVED